VKLGRGDLRLSFGVSGFYTHTGHEEDCPDIGPECSTATPPKPEWHDLGLTFLLFRIEAEYGITKWLSVDALGFIRTTDVSFQLQDFATRAPIEGMDIHHRSETITGPADPWLSAHAAHAFGRWTTGLRLGFTLPIGSTVADPFELGREGKPHEHIQYGTGTVDPIMGADVSVPAGRLTADAFTLARIALYENDQGYHAGQRVIGGAGAALPWRSFRFRLGLDLAYETAETWRGIVETEGNLGRTDLLVDTMAQWSFARNYAMGLSARVPVYTHAEGAELTIPAMVELSIERTLRF